MVKISLFSAMLMACMAVCIMNLHGGQALIVDENKPSQTEDIIDSSTTSEDADRRLLKKGRARARSKSKTKQKGRKGPGRL